MGALARLACLAALAGLALTPAGCGQSEPGAGDHAARGPLTVPRPDVTAEERTLWAPRPPDRSAVPVLRFTAIDPQAFARQMVLLDHAGYTTITLDELIRFVNGENVSLPPHPLVVTFDGGRLDAWTGSDGILGELGMNAAVFVDVGRVEEKDPKYLTWEELNALERSGRWDVQLQSGTGNRLIRYGQDPDEVGPFYAYRGADEVLGGWRERVFSDITYGEQQLAFHVQGYRPLAIAPPHGNYGQAGTNDRRIPRELRARLLLTFQLIFTQDRSGLATAGATNPLGRFDITRDVTNQELHALITSENRR